MIIDEEKLLIASSVQTIWDALKTNILHGKHIHCNFSSNELDKFTLNQIEKKHCKISFNCGINLI